MFIWRVVVFYFHLKQIQPYISGGWCNDREIVLAKWHIHLNPWKPFFVWHLFPLFCRCPALECYENFKQAMTALFTATSRFCVLFRSCLETLQGFSEKGKYITARSAFDSPYWSLALLRLWTGGIDSWNSSNSMRTQSRDAPLTYAHAVVNHYESYFSSLQ